MPEHKEGLTFKKTGVKAYAIQMHLIQVLTPAEILKVVELYEAKQLDWLYEDGFYEYLHAEKKEGEGSE